MNARNFATRLDAIEATLQAHATPEPTLRWPSDEIYRVFMAVDRDLPVPDDADPELVAFCSRLSASF